MRLHFSLIQLTVHNQFWLQYLIASDLARGLGEGV